MREPIDGKSGNEAPPGAAQPPGRPLYARGAHWLARTGFTLMLLLYVVGVVGVATTFTAHPLSWRDVAGLFMIVAFPLVVAPNLRTWAIYGSVQGLEIVRWGTRRMIPWSSVGAAEYAWWSLNYAARVARLTINDEGNRSILFFADDRVLGELDAMRALHAIR